MEKELIRREVLWQRLREIGGQRLRGSEASAAAAAAVTATEMLAADWLTEQWMMLTLKWGKNCSRLL